MLTTALLPLLLSAALLTTARPEDRFDWCNCLHPNMSPFPEAGRAACATQYWWVDYDEATANCTAKPNTKIVENVFWNECSAKGNGMIVMQCMPPTPHDKGNPFHRRSVVEGVEEVEGW